MSMLSQPAAARGCGAYNGSKPKDQAMGGIATGTRVKAVFRDERKGSIADFYLEQF